MGVLTQKLSLPLSNGVTLQYLKLDSNADKEILRSVSHTIFHHSYICFWILEVLFLTWAGHYDPKSSFFFKKNTLYSISQTRLCHMTLCIVTFFAFAEPGCVCGLHMMHLRAASLTGLLYSYSPNFVMAFSWEVMCVQVLAVINPSLRE